MTITLSRFAIAKEVYYRIILNWEQKCGVHIMTIRFFSQQLLAFYFKNVLSRYLLEC